MKSKSIRLNRFISSAGITSRRGADELIKAGRVLVNGKVATIGTSIDPTRDHVKVDGKLIKSVEDRIYILLYKPAGFICSLKDPSGRPLVIDLLKSKEIRSRRIYHVGRLDLNSEGLLLLTDDGDFANQVGHPSTGPEKTYHVRVRGVPTEKELDKMRSGILINGLKTYPAKVRVLRSRLNTWLEVTLKEGRNRQIRKMFQALGHPVVKLKRVAIGPLTTAGIKPGQYRRLSEYEIKSILK